MKKIILWTLFLLLMTGCQSVTSPRKSKWTSLPGMSLFLSKYGKPAQMAAIWTPDVVIPAGHSPVRGFGGRFYFYNEKNEPVAVDGQLMVYAFDDSNSEPGSKQQADRKYVFSPEQFQGHYSESELGPSYSVWIPWDAVGGQQRSISLLPVFTTTSGQVLVGQQAMNVLPGASPQRQEAADGELANEPAVRPASHSMPVDQREKMAEKTDQPAVETTTIKLPPSLRNRLIHSTTAANDQPPIRTALSEQLARQRNELLAKEAAEMVQSINAPPAPATPTTVPAGAPVRPTTRWATPPLGSSSRFVPTQSPVPATPGAQSNPAAAPWQPHLPAQPSRRPF